MFSLTAVILSSIYVTIDTRASSVAELCLEGFFSYSCTLFWYSQAEAVFYLSAWKAVFPFKAEKLYFHFEKDFEIKVCLFLALNTMKMVLKHDQKVNVVLMSLQSSVTITPKLKVSLSRVAIPR